MFASLFTNKEASYITNMYQLMLYNLSSTLTPDVSHTQYNSEDNVKYIFTKRSSSKFFVLVLKNKGIVNVPISNSNYRINQYVKISSKDLILALNTFPKNSADFVMLEAKDKKAIAVLKEKSKTDSNPVLIPTEWGC